MEINSANLLKEMNNAANKSSQTFADKERKQLGGATLSDFRKQFGIKGNESGTNYNEQTSEMIRLLGAVDIQDGINYNANLTAYQSNLEKWARGAKMLGKGVVSGFLQNLASLDFGSIRDMATGDTSKEFGNALTESTLAKWAKDTTGLEIYQNGDDFGSIAYWSRFIGQQGFTLGIMAEMALEQGLLAITTGGAGNVAGAASKSRLLYNLLTGVNGLYGGVREAWMNGLETQENVYNKMIQMGFSQEEAKKKASQAAAIGFRAEVGPTMLLNGIQSLVTFGKFASKGLNKALEESMDFGVSSAVGKIGNIFEKSNNKFLKNAGVLLTDSISEGVEEGFQTAVGTYTTKEMYEKNGLRDSSLSYWNEEMRDSILMGALSGGMMAGFGKAVRGIGNWGKDKAINESTEAFMKDVTSNSVTAIKELNDASLAYQKAFETYNKDKTKDNRNAMNEAKKNLIIAQEKQGTAQVLQAMELDQLKGNENNEVFNAHIEQIDSAIKALQSNDTDKLKGLGFIDENGQSVTGLTNAEMIRMLQSDRDKALKTKKRFEDHYQHTTTDLGTIKKLVTIETQIDIYEDMKKEIEGKIGNYRNGNQVYSQLSEDGKELYDLYLRKNALEGLKERGGISKNQEVELDTIKHKLQSIADANGKKNVNDLYSVQDANILRRDMIGIQAQQENYIEHYAYETEIDKLYESLEHNSKQDVIKKNIKERRKAQREAAKAVRDFNKLEREQEKERKRLEKEKAKAKSKEEKEKAQKEIDELAKEQKETKEKKDKAQKVESIEKETGNKASDTEKEELINKDQFFDEEPVVVTSQVQEEPTKEPTEVTESATEEAMSLKKLIEEGKIRIGVPTPADVSPFDESEGIEEDFVATPIDDSEPIVNTEPLEIIDFDANANLEGDFEGMRERAKELVARVLEELDLDEPDFEAFIKYFIDRKGKKIVDEGFPGYVKMWELAGYSLEDVDAVYDKFFNTASVATDLAFELMNNGTLVNKFNEGSEATAIASQAPVIATKGNKVIRDDRGVGIEVVEDTATENPNPKAAHLGVKYETVTLPNGVKAKRYSEVELNNDPFIDNHLVLDKNFLSPGRILEVRVAEDALVTVWDKDSNGNNIKKTVRFKDLGLQPGTPEYNAKVPIVAYFGDKPVFFLHDHEWYNRTNISNRHGMQDQIIKDGSRMINEVRRQILEGGKTQIKITDNLFGNILNLSNAAREKDQQPITLNEASKGSQIVIAETTNTIKSGGKLVSTADLVNDFKKNPLIPGAAYEIREIGDGKKILLSVASNRTGELDSMPDIGYNTVKFGLLAAFYLLNKNDSRFEGTVTGITKNKTIPSTIIVKNADGTVEEKVVTVKQKLESMGMNEQKARAISEAIHETYNIDITEDAHLLFELFTTTATGRGSKQQFFQNATNPNNKQKVTLLPKKNSEGRISVNYHVKGYSKAPVTFDGENLKAVEMKLNVKPDDNEGFISFFNFMKALFEPSNDERAKGVTKGAFSYNNFMPNDKQLGRNKPLVNITNNGEITSYQSSNGNSTYVDFAKDTLRTNIKSFEIEGADGNKKSVLDIQPMIYYEVVDGEVTAPQATSAPNVTPITPTTTPQKTEVNVGQVVAAAKEEGEQSDFAKRKAQALKAVEDMKSLIDTETGGVMFTQEMYEQALAAVHAEFNEDHNAAVSITMNQYHLIQSTKNNRIDGISILEENELLNTLFYSTLEGVDLNKHEVTLSSIQRSLYNSLKLVENTIQQSEVMAMIKPELAPIMNKRVEKLKAVLNQKEKLIGKEGSLMIMLNRFFGEEIEFNEEALEDSDESIISIQDGDGTEKNYSESSLEKNVKITFSSSLKILLARVKAKNNQGSNKLNSLQLPMFEDIDNVVMTLQEVLVKGNSDFDFVLQELKNRGESTRPNAQVYAELYRLFADAPKQIQNEILYKMTSDVLSMYMILMQDGAYNNHTKLAMQNANSSASDIRLVREWKNNFLNSELFFEKDGEKYYNMERVNLLNKEINSLRNDYKELSADNPEHVQKLNNILRKLGINLSENTLKELLSTEGNNFLSNVGSLTHIQAVLNKVNTFYQTERIDPKTGEKVHINPKYTDEGLSLYDVEATNIRNNYANLEIDLNGSVIEKSYRVAGKTIQGTVQKMMAYDAVFELKDSSNSKAEQLLQVPYSSRNYMLRMMVPENNSVDAVNMAESMRNMFDIGFVSLEAIKERYKKTFGSRKITDISDTDNVLAQLGFFQNTVKKLSHKVPGYESLPFRLAKVMNPTLSDKNQMLLYDMAVVDVTNSILSNTFADKGNQYNIGEDLLNFLTDQIFESELDRIISSFKEKTNVKKYDKAAQFFLAFPGFNTLELTMEDGTKMSLIEFLHINKGLAKGEENILAKRQDIREIAKQYLANLVKEKAKDKVNFDNNTGEWFDNNFISMNEKGGFENNFLDDSYLASKVKGNPIKSVEVAAYDFVINNMLAQNNVYQMIAGDTALYSENPSKFADKKEPKNISKIDFVGLAKKTAENIDKRMAMLIAPGNKLANSLHEKYLQIMVNDPVTITSTSRKLIKQYYGEVTKENEQAIAAIEEFEEKAEKARGIYLDELRNDYSKRYVKINDKFVSVDSDGEIHYSDSIEAAESLGKVLKGVDGYQTFLKENNKEIGDYFDIEGTDAQELTTWQEHLDILLRQGRLTEEERNNIKAIYDKLSKGEVLNSKELKVVMQPIKPVYAGSTIVRNDKNEPILNRVTYIKSSSFPLLPQLTAGLKMDAVRKHMEKLQEHHKGNRKVRLSFQTANKVGSIDSTLSIHDLYNKTFDELFNKSTLLNDNTLELERKHFKIQQDTPYKTEKNIANGKDDSIIMGSQMWKIILGNGINKIEEAIFPNTFDAAIINEYNSQVSEKDRVVINNSKKNLTGKDLDKIKSYVENKYIRNEKNKLYRQLGLDPETNKPKDEAKFIKTLQELLISEAKSRNYTDGLLDGLEVFEDLEKIDFNIPLWLSSGSNKFEALLQAIISNRLIVLKLPGNSHYTASSEGFSFRKEEIISLDSINENKKSGIVWFDPNHTGELKATTNENGTLKEAEVLIQSKFRITKEDGTTELIDLTKAPYSEEDKATGKKVLNKEMIDQALLSMFSFRIPTSSHQSGAILKVVGFLPEASGDLIVVPKEHTKQIGEDYDIDKRNIYKSNYVVKEDGKIEKLTYANSGLEKQKELKSQIPILKQKIKEATLRNIELYENIQQLDEIDENNENILSDILRGDNSYTSEEQKELLRLLKLSREEKTALQADLGGIIKELRETLISYKQENNIEKKLLENAMIDVYKSVYLTTNDKVQKKINKILSFEVAGETAKLIDKKLNSMESTKYFTIYDDSYQRKLMRLGSTGKLGISVHSNTVTFLSQIQRLEKPIVVKKTVYDEKDNKNFVNSEMELDGLYSDGTLGGFNNEFKTLDGMRLISDVVGENQNSATDNVKAQIMGKRNENAYTINVLTMLNLRGYDMTKNPIALDNGKKQHLQLTSLFLSQPILRRYVELQEKYKSLTSGYVKDKENEIIRQLINEFDIINPNKTLNDFNASGEIYSNEELRVNEKQITGQGLYNGLIDNKNTQNTVMQLAVLQTFLNLKRESEEIGEYQKLISMNSTKLGISYFNTLDRIDSLINISKEEKFENIRNLIGDFEILDDDTSAYRIRELKDKGYVGFNYFTVMVKPTTPEGTMLVNSLKTSESVFDQLYPYKKPAIKDILEKIISIAGKKNVRGEALNDLRYTIMQEFKEFIYSSKNSGLFEDATVREERERLFFDRAGNESLASFINRLQKMDNNFLKNNEFIRSLQADVSLTGGVSTIKNLFEEMDKFSQSNRYNDYLKMLQDNKTVIGEWNGYKVTPFQLAQELATYAYFADQEGGATGFRNNINANYLNVIGFSKYLRDVNNEIFGTIVTDAFSDKFVEQFFQHNPDQAVTLSQDKLKKLIGANDKFESILINKGSKEAYNIWRSKPNKNIYNDFISKLKRFESPISEENGNTALNDEYVSIRYNKANGKAYKLFKLVDTEITGSGKVNIYEEIAVLGDNGYNEYDMEAVYNDGSLNPVGDIEHTEPVISAKPLDLSEVQETTVGELLGAVFQKESKLKDLMNDLLPFIDKDVKVIFSDNYNGKNVSIATYMSQENVIVINPMMKNDNFVKRQQQLAKSENYIQEVVLEEIIHSITVSELSKWGVRQTPEGGNPKEFNYVVREDAPLYIKKLNDLYELAKTKIPYDPTNHATYPMMNIAEFVAGVFSNGNFRELLDSTKDGGETLLDKFRKLFKNLITYLTGKKYSDEVMTTVMELLKAKGRSTEFVTTDRSTKEFKDSEAADKVKTILRQLKAEDVKFTDEISPYSPKQLSQYAYRKSFSDNIINDLKSGKTIFVNEKNSRNEVEKKYIQDVIDLILSVPGMNENNKGEAMEYKKVRNDLYMLKIKDTFAEKLAKLDSVSPENFDYSGFNLQQAINHIMKENPSFTTRELKDKLKEIGLIKEDC
jgi:protein PXR1